MISISCIWRFNLHSVRFRTLLLKICFIIWWISWLTNDIYVCSISSWKNYCTSGMIFPSYLFNIYVYATLKIIIFKLYILIPIEAHHHQYLPQHYSELCVVGCISMVMDTSFWHPKYAWLDSGALQQPTYPHHWKWYVLVLEFSSIHVSRILHKYIFWHCLGYFTGVDEFNTAETLPLATQLNDVTRINYYNDYLHNVLLAIK